MCVRVYVCACVYVCMHALVMVEGPCISVPMGSKAKTTNPRDTRLISTTSRHDEAGDGWSRSAREDVGGWMD